jgi:hypothetical protein
VFPVKSSSSPKSTIGIKIINNYRKYKITNQFEVPIETQKAVKQNPNAEKRTER